MKKRRWHKTAASKRWAKIAPRAFFGRSQRAHTRRYENFVAAHPWAARAAEIIGAFTLLGGGGNS